MVYFYGDDIVKRGESAIDILFNRRDGLWLPG
jgi:hypothetical protein